MRYKILAVSMLSLLPIGGIIAQQPETPQRAERRVITSFALGSQSWLGVYTEEISRENAGKFGLREVRGVGVTKIEPKSPAEEAGFQVNDVIVSFDGENVSSVRKLTRLISEVAPEHQAVIRILRNGNEQEITVTMGKRNNEFIGSFGSATAFPVPELMPFPPSGGVQILRGELPNAGNNGNFLFNVAGANRRIGIDAVPLTKQLADYFGVAEGKGLLINNVMKGSAADKAGLKAGDVILEVDGKAVADLGGFIREINAKPEGDVMLTILHDKQRQTVKVTPEKGQSQQVIVERKIERQNR